jgi:hypothetical protein
VPKDGRSYSPTLFAQTVRVLKKINKPGNMIVAFSNLAERIKVRKKRVFSQMFSKEKSHCQPGVVIHACNPNYSLGKGRKITSLKSAWAKLVRPKSQKQNTNKRAGGVA